MKTSEELAMLTPADHVSGPRQGEWTYDAYAALPDDDKRYEIIDGVLYMTPSPMEWHQRAATRLTTYLTIYIDFAGLGRVYATFDVVLTPKNVVEPDILVVLNKNMAKITNSHIVGGPDLVVEIASPSTAKLDRSKKYDLYAQAGVSEYWIIEPTEYTIEVLTLQGSTYSLVGVFSGDDLLPSHVIPDFPVPVRKIFDK
jgi:Uma2 family endonuclease